MVSERPSVEVLAGERADGLTWRVLARDEEPDNFKTYVERRLGDKTAKSGFGGPKLNPGQLVNTWTGRSDGTPPFFLLRADPNVTGVVLKGASGRSYDVPLSGVVHEFDLRFGAVPLPEDEDIVEVLIGSSSGQRLIDKPPHAGNTVTGEQRSAGWRAQEGPS